MRNWTRLLATATIAAALAMAGCSGDDGKDGPAGPTGPRGPQGETGPAGPGVEVPPVTGAALGTLDGAITAVSIDTSASAIASVTFEVADAAGLPVTGLQNFEFTIAKLVTDGAYPRWQSYINRSRLRSGGVGVLRAAGERQVATEVAGSPGVYEYTFKTDLDAVKDFIYYGAEGAPAAPGTGSSGPLTSDAALAILPTLNLDYDPSAVHRISVVGRASGSRYNASIDFVPANLPTLQAATSNQVITTESCGSCHGLSANRGELYLPNVHGNGRYTMETCVACHNESTFDSRSSTDTEWAEISLTTMIHKMHNNDVDYSVDGRDYTSVHYPQSISNCLTCHDNNRMPKPEGRSAVDAVAFQERPSTEACGTCHEINFNEPFSHQFAGADPATCLGCHGPDSGIAPVAAAHVSVSSSPNNPLQPAGFVQFEYQIASVTVNETNQPIVTFRLLANGQPVDVQALPAGVGLGNMRFYAAWSAAHPGGGESGPAIAMPQDFNNLGTTQGRVWWDLDLALGAGGAPLDPSLTPAQRTAQALKSFDQPRALGNLGGLTGFVGTLTPAADGYFVTAPGVNGGFAFPADAVLKAIHIEGRPQSQGVNIDTSMQIAFAGTPRRKIVSEASCLACHETIVFHGGGRINGPDTCATCHNPEMSSSNIFSGVIPEGTNGAGMSITGQLSMNLKDLLHATHAGKPVGGAPIREIPFSFIRGTVAGGQGQGPYDFSDIGFPAALSDCGACHLPDTYKLPINGNALWSVVDGYNNATAPSVTAPHDPSATVRIGPVTATCYGCHNTAAALTHYELNATSSGEACGVCHGPGKIVPGHVD